MNEPQTAISAFLPDSIHGELRKIAEKHKRSLTKEVEWVLERYVNAERENGA